MRLSRTRTHLAVVSSVLLVALAICSTAVVEAAPRSHAIQRTASPAGLVGQQTHKAGSTGTATPQIAIKCFITDKDSHPSRFVVSLQGLVSCQAPATIDITAYLDTCSYWNYSEGFCQGAYGYPQWIRGGGVHCHAAGVTSLYCPNPALRVTVQLGKGLHIRICSDHYHTWHRATHGYW